jgi:hypothetical protein
MEYNRLPKLINTYPQTSNYVTTGIDKSSLFGLYSDVNKVDFNLVPLQNVHIVPDTKFRTIIAIYEDRNDETPQYYTSEIYHRDLEASKVEANPYFLNSSFESFYIVDIYLKELVDSLDAYKDAELKLELNFIRNNFIFFNNAGITAAPKKIFDVVKAVAEADGTLSRNNQIDSLGESITKLENEISNVSNKIKRRGLFGSRAEIDFEAETYVVATSETAILPWDGTATAPINQVNEVTPASTKPLFLALGIEFYQEINGQMYPLKNGAFNPLSVAKVDSGV